MIKRETLVSLLAGLLVGALGIAPVVAGDGFGFGPAQGGGGVTDAELTAIGALTPADGNVIVGDGATWVAESGATARASLGALGGPLGSTDNVLLRSDGTGGVTAQGSDATLSDAELLDLGATGILAVSGGSASAVGIQVARDANTGLYGTADTSIGMAIAGTERLSVSTTGVTLASGSAAATPALSLGDADSGLWSSAGTVFGWSVNGSNRFSLDNTALYSVGPIDAPAGTVSAVAYRIHSDANTGIYGTANSNVSVAINGSQIASVGTVGLTARSYTEAVTGNYTLADAQSLQVFHNTGAGGAITIELGSITATGFSATFVATDNQDVTLNPGNSDKFVGLAGGWADGEAMLVDDQNDAVRITRLSTGDWLVEWTRGTLTEETP